MVEVESARNPVHNRPTRVPPPLTNLELPVPALCEELERGFEETEAEAEDPVDEPEDPVERPSGDPRLSLTL